MPDDLTDALERLAEDAFNEGWRSREARPSPMLNSRAEMRREWLDSNARDAILAHLSRFQEERDSLAAALHNAVLALALEVSPDHAAVWEGGQALAKYDPERPSQEQGGTGHGQPG